MIISLIVSFDNSWGIGRGNTIPWHLSSDLKRFKRLTMGHHIIMGRKTWQSIGKLLPGRTSIVISRSHKFESEGCIISRSLESALRIAKTGGETEVFIIGGGELFSQTIDRADCLYITEVHTNSGADIFFPKLHNRDWQVVYNQSQLINDKDQFASTFKILVRNSSLHAGTLISRFDEDYVSKMDN